jgi:tetratricopeptide (TPR) repeat protein
VFDFAHVREWLLPRLKTPVTWAYVTLGLALSAAAGHFLQSYFLAGFEKAAGLSESVVGEWTCEHLKTSIKRSHDQFTVLVSPLQGDKNGDQTEKIFIALGGQRGIQLFRLCQSLQINVGNEEYITQRIKAAQRVNDILKEWRADLVLFGKVAADSSAFIWTVNEHGGCDFSGTPVVLKNGAFPGEFERDTKAKLLGAVLREIAAACHHGDDMNWDLFKGQMRKLTELMRWSKLDLPEEEQLELSTSYYNGLNLLYHHDGDDEWFQIASAFANYEINSTTTSRKANALYFYGRALVSKGLRKDDKPVLNLSIKMFEQFLEMMPASELEVRADVLMMRSDAYRWTDDAGLAFQDLSEVIRLLPVSAPIKAAKALTARSGLHSLKGDFGLAIQDLDEAIRLLPKSASEERIRALTLRSEAHSRKDDVGLAIQDLDEAIRLSPKNPDLLNSRCYELAKIDRLELALADCNESLNFRANDSNTLDSRGFVYLKMKQPESAINDYDAALRLNSKNANSLYGRGVAHVMLGNDVQGGQDIAAAKAIKADIGDELARYGMK